MPTNPTPDHEPSGCNCDNKTTYSKSAINAACTHALSLASQGETTGRDKYPHAYNGPFPPNPTPYSPKTPPLPHPLALAPFSQNHPDYEHFSFPNAQKPYLEFPILESGEFTGNESPGADRIVIGSIATDYSSAVYCATLTHDGSTKNGFTECKDDTVNTDGKGSYTSKTEGRGREPGPGRELLERIDLK